MVRILVTIRAGGEGQVAEARGGFAVHGLHWFVALVAGHRRMLAGE